LLLTLQQYRSVRMRKIKGELVFAFSFHDTGPSCALLCSQTRFGVSRREHLRFQH